MKKISVILMMLAISVMAAKAECQDGPYGLKINGTTVVDAPKFGETDWEGRVQYRAVCVELNEGDTIQLVNQSCDATWMVDLDEYGQFANFSGGKEEGRLICVTEGKFDFYIKLSAKVGDLVYVEYSKNCGGGEEPPTGCQDGPYGLKINNSTTVDAPLYGDMDMQGRVQYMASCVELSAGDVVQLVNQSCGATWMVDLDPFGHYENFTGGKDANQLTCNVAGKYDFYIKLSMQAGDLVYVESSQTCGGGGVTPTPGYTTSAPAQCPDVLLQAFYWNSYQDKGYGRTKWIDHLNGNSGSTADEIGKWFDLVWLPPMSKATGGTGYIPTNYSDLNSDWGTKKKLELLIDTLHKNGARVVADIVINHGAAWSGWCDFAQLNFGSYGTYKPDASWICSTDEMNSNPQAGACKGKATGNPDDGYGPEGNYDSGRDWDHNNAEVRDMFKAYLKWLRNEIKIDGFRYDYCKGFHNSHIDDYNRAAEAYFSVMEFWDGNISTLQYHLNDAGWNTLTFDFATKYQAFNDGLASDNMDIYCNLKGAGLPGAGKSRYAVTFLDSHDTFQRDANEFCGEGKSMTDCYGKIMQCYAYLLSMPGVPLVFWPHWVSFKEEIKPLINARYKTGVHSESGVNDECGSGFYKATIYGTNGEIRLLIGPNSGYNSTPAGYTLAGKGTNYGVYYKMTTPRGDKDTERPDRTQGIEEVNGEIQKAKGDKFIQDGHLYIRCGEKVYDGMGRLVK